MRHAALLIAGARQLLTLAGSASPRRRREMSRIGLIEDGAVLIRDGLITATGRTTDIAKLPAARPVKC